MPYTSLPVQLDVTIDYFEHQYLLADNIFNVDQDMSHNV